MLKEENVPPSSAVPEAVQDDDNGIVFSGFWRDCDHFGFFVGYNE
jgi:hypothetical protein